MSDFCRGLVDCSNSELSLCVKNTYFMFHGKMYLQINGLPMGAPTSVFAAEIFMMKLEQTAINTFIHPPTIWKRYVDDTFVKIKKVHKDAFLDHLNAQHSRIEFTSEEIEDNKIAFLDSEVNMDPNGNLYFKIYRKPTHTSQYLNFQSNHHISQKLGIVATFNHRIDNNITKEEDKTVEREEIRSALKANGYPDWALNRKINKEKGTHDNSDHLATASIPYVKSLSEKIARTYKKFRIRTVHKPSAKIGHQLCQVKDPIHDLDKIGAVYQVDCQKHKATYIGETSKALKHRAYEHHILDHKTANKTHSLQHHSTSNNIEATTNSNHQEAENKTRKSARINSKQQLNYKDLHTGANLIWSEGNTEVSKHIAEFDHEPQDVTIKAITYDNNWHRRGYKEALEIRRRHPNLNQDQGRTFIPHIYGRVIDATLCADSTSTTEKSEGNLPDTSPQTSSEDGGPNLMATESSSAN